MDGAAGVTPRGSSTERDTGAVAARDGPRPAAPGPRPRAVWVDTVCMLAALQHPCRVQHDHLVQRALARLGLLSGHGVVLMMLLMLRCYVGLVVWYWTMPSLSVAWMGCCHPHLQILWLVVGPRTNLQTFRNVVVMYRLYV